MFEITGLGLLADCLDVDLDDAVVVLVAVRDEGVVFSEEWVGVVACERKFFALARVIVVAVELISDAKVVRVHDLDARVTELNCADRYEPGEGGGAKRPDPKKRKKRGEDDSSPASFSQSFVVHGRFTLPSRRQLAIHVGPFSFASPAHARFAFVEEHYNASYKEGRGNLLISYFLRKKGG